MTKRKYYRLPVRLVVITGLFWLITGVSGSSIRTSQGPEIITNRMKWWRDAEFGMFIHWGIYALPAKGAWYMHDSRIPRKKYEKYAAEFDPVKFDADQWVHIAKEAGMKYLVITSKHHDGFCMFRTKATRYNVVDATPWHKDPLKALSEACRKQGIKFGVYYSIMDWHSPDQLPHDDSIPQHPIYSPTKMKPGKRADYIRYMKTQLRELITQYDPAVLWFDGSWPSLWNYQDGKEIYSYLKRLKPDLIINNRINGHLPKGVKKPEIGDFGTPEQHIPPNGITGKYWETCMTINNSWAYKKLDNNFKSDTTLIHNLIDIASKGGNYLLDVGPTAEGIIPEPEVTRLKEMGHWLHTYGDAIYAAQASPFKEKLSWGRITRKRGKLYLEIFRWPEDGKIILPAYKGRIISAYLLGDPTRKGVTAHAVRNGIEVNLPGKAPNGIASVVELDFRL